MSPKLQYRSALKLISNKRLDIILKMGFAESLPYDNKYVEDLYCRHIMARTAGVEDHKLGVSQFVIEFRQLIESIGGGGFKESGAIEWSAVDHVNRNGAHRIAAAAVKGLDVPFFETDFSGYREWGWEWFLENGFEDDLPFIYKIYTKYFPHGGIAIQWDLSNIDIANMIRSETTVVGEMELNFSDEEMYEFILDVYARDTGVGSSSIIKRKARILSRLSDRIRVFLCESGHELSKLKSVIRNEFYNKTEMSYMIMHASDNDVEYQYLSEILFSKNNMKSLRARKKISRETQGWLELYIKELQARDISLNDVCVVGSTVMEVFGIRKSTDVDFIMGEAHRNIKFGNNNVCVINDDVDLASFGYLRLAGKSVSDDEIIYVNKNYFIFRGLKLIDLRHVYDRKHKQLRDKDLQDVKLIEESGVLVGGSEERKIWRKLESSFLYYFKTLPNFWFKKIYMILRPYIPSFVICIGKKLFR